MNKAKVKLKSPADITVMRRGGKILASVVDTVIKNIKPGVTAQYLNDLTVKLIKDKGGQPSFEGYTASWAPMAFPSAVCVSVNEEVVHGLAESHKIFKNGDVVGIDIGLEYQGLFTDMAKTVIVGSADKPVVNLVKTAEQALLNGIKAVKPGNHISDISKAIENTVKAKNFSVVKQLVGHGVGYQVHEPPQIPNYQDNSLTDLKLQVGMCLALEPMVNFGGWEVENLADGWTVVTKDRSISAHFEHTVAVTETGCEILTKQ